MEADILIIYLVFDKFDMFEALKGVNEEIYVIGYSMQRDLNVKFDKYCDIILSKTEFSNRLPEMLQ
jgi:hypothetical protein